MISYTVWLGLGSAVGWLSFIGQHWTVSQLDPGNGKVVFVWLALGMILRWAAAAILLFMSLRLGLLFGLSAAIGLLLARWLALITYTCGAAQEA